MARPVRTRPAFTLVEVLAVLAVLIIVGAVLVPSLTAFRSDTGQRAAADVISSEIAFARARAKEEGRPYRVALGTDGSRIRRAPDDMNFESVLALSEPNGVAIASEYAFDNFVTATIIPDPTTNVPVPTPNGDWVTLATVQPDGTCLESSALVAIKEDDRTLYMRLRGLTASVRVVPNPNNSSHSTNGGSP